MYRNRINELIKWKKTSTRKPLLILGVRQVGKTWLMKELGNKHFKSTVYLNFEKNRHLSSVFTEPFDLKRILLALQAETGVNVIPGETLIILDEIQEVPEAITALKYFFEDAPEYHVIAAGSLLGVSINGISSFPVGKIDLLMIYPLTFNEFLNAMGEENLVSLLKGHDWKLISAFHQKYSSLLRQYYYTGGMPEVVQKYSINKDLKEVRNIQNNILKSYEQDFSQHVPKESIPRIRLLWQSIPSQLAKENKKFIYGLVREGARAKDYELSLLWLEDCGLVNKVRRVSKPALPLKAYEENNVFKLFISDVGLLNAMANLDPGTLLLGSELLTEFKGAFTEQFVFQELRAAELFTVSYWSAQNARAEIDFLLQFQSNIYPVEVKSEVNLKSKSLVSYISRFAPAKAVRISMSSFKINETLIDLPLYALSELNEILR